MGRRALRKIDPALELSPFLRTLEQLPQPWDTTAVFGRSAPVEVEMGSGKGLFLSRAATDHPETNYLGIEVVHKYARFTAARLARHNAVHARIVHGDGLRLFREWLPSDSLRAVHVYFPDPWWKKRHRKRRVMNESFLADVQRTLQADGRLHFWSDVREYFDESLDLIARHTNLVGPLAVAERPAEHDLDYRTNFERRMRLHEQPVYRAEFVRPAERADSGDPDIPS